MLPKPVSTLLLLVLAAHAGILHAADRQQAAASVQSDDDGDGPDYYDGQDAPTGGTVNPESVGARPKQKADDDDAEPAPGPLWLDIRGDGALSFQQDRKIAAYTAFRIGKRFPIFIPLDLYAQARFDRDQRDIAWDNRVDAGAGLRLNFSKRHPLSLSAEIVGGEYLRSSFAAELADGAPAVPTGFFTEMRAGLSQRFAWGHVPEDIYAEPPLFAFPLRFWGQLRSELLLSSLNRLEAFRAGADVLHHRAFYQNASVSLHPDMGFLLMEGGAGDLAAYATGQVRVNTLGYWWDNLAMAGPGLAYQPLHAVDLWVKAEYLTGEYFRSGRKSDPRPYPKKIRDLRIFLDLKYDLGI